MGSNRADGLYTFRYNATQYTGRYKDGLRTGPWQARSADGSGWDVSWVAGEWHGPTTTWWKGGVKEEEGSHERGKRTGQWSFWFSNGQPAARGEYRDDRKMGPWEYYDQDGGPMAYTDWEREFTHWDWAYDDYTGTPRGENWPSPPDEAMPIEEH